MSRSLLTIRSQHGMQDDGARFHIISHLLLETMNSAKALLATSILFKEESYEASSNMKEASYILNIIQRDRVLAAVCFTTFISKISNASAFIFFFFWVKYHGPFMRAHTHLSLCKYIHLRPVNYMYYLGNYKLPAFL